MNTASQAFSILEVLIVLLIISISTVVAINYLPRSANNSLYDDAMRLTSAIDQASNYARRTGSKLTWYTTADTFGFSSNQIIDDLPKALQQQQWLSQNPVSAHIYPEPSSLVISQDWLVPAFTITLDNGLDRLSIARDMYGSMELIYP